MSKNINPTEWLNQVWLSELPANSKYLCAFFRKYLHNEATVCWPSKSEIHEVTGLADKTVDKHIKILVKEGWIKVKTGGPGYSNRYSIAYGCKINPKVNKHLYSSKSTPTYRGKTTVLKSNIKSKKNNNKKGDVFDRLVDRSWAEEV